MSAAGADKFDQTTPDAFGGKNFTPGKLLKDQIKFFIIDKSKHPVSGVTVDFKIFDITAIAKTPDDSAIKTAISDNWDAANPVLYSDFTTTKCSDKNGACTPAEAVAEKGRGSEANQTIWLGQLSGQATTSDATGKVSTAYTAPRIFDRTIAVAMKVPQGSIAADLVQFVKIHTTNIKQYLGEGDGTLVTSVLTPVPNPVQAGGTFDLLLEADIPDTGSDTVNFTFKATNVPGASLTETKVPDGSLACTFLNGQCLVPGGPYKILLPGQFDVAITPAADTKIIKPIADQAIKVVRGKATKLVISSTAPDKGITPLCANPADLTQDCLVLSADVDAQIVYPVLLDDGGNYVGATSTTWTIRGPLAGRDDSDSVAFEQTLKPLTAGPGSATVTTGTLTTSFTYRILPGAPTSMTVTTEHATATSVIEAATVPFKALLSVFDKKNNLCTNYSSPMALTFGAANANPSVPPTGSGWVAVNPVTNFSETVTFTGGVGGTTNKITLVQVPAAGQAPPQITVSGGILTATASSPNIVVQPGPTTQSLLRNASGGLGSPWVGTTAVAPNLQYFFGVAGYDSAGNYTTDVFSKFYGVASALATPPASPAFDLTASLPGFLTLDPSQYNNATTNCPGAGTALTNALISCPLHLSLTVKSGISTIFSGAGFPGAGQLLAIPQLFDAQGHLQVAPALSGLISINSGAATSFSVQIVDKATGVQVPMNPSNQPIVNAGQLFNVLIQARDVNNIIASTYVGPKLLSVVNRVSPSWGGFLPVIPPPSPATAPSYGCTFVAGSCTLPGDYQIYDNQVNAVISIQDATPLPALQVPKLWTTLVQVQAGPDFQTYVVSNKGGPAKSATILSLPIGLTADQEQPLAVAVADAFGNWSRDMAPGEAVWDGTTDITGVRPPHVTVPNATNTWASSDIFASVAFPGSVTVKFLPTTDPQVLVAADKDATKYDIVYEPADRVGTGWILAKSGTQPALIANPSPLFTVVPGALEHAEFADLLSPTGVESPGTCIAPTVNLHDRKHNLISDYTGIVNVGLKMFLHGVADPTPGNIGQPAVPGPATGMYAIVTDPMTWLNSYSALNAAVYPELSRGGFQIGATALAGGHYFNYADADYYHSSRLPRHYIDFIVSPFSFVAGQLSMPPSFCFFDSQTATTAYVERDIQIELPAYVTSTGKSFLAFTSRGPKTYGSTATFHSHPDYFRTNLGTPDHVHFSLADSKTAPNYLPIGNYIDWGVDAVCPNTAWCGPKTFYMHQHDRGCNLIGPETAGGATLTGTLPPSAIVAGGVGALGSPSWTITPTLLPAAAVGQGAAFTFAASDIGLFPAPQGNPPPVKREGFLDGTILSPGAPAKIVAQAFGNPSASIDNPFGVSIELEDQFGNPAGTAVPYSMAQKFYFTNRNLAFSWNASNGPHGDVPLIGGPYLVDNTFFTGVYSSGPADFSLFDAGQTVTVTATLTDSAATSWSASNALGPQTYTTSFNLIPSAGTPVTFQLLDAPAATGNVINAGATLVSGTNLPLFACLKDAKGNVTSCNLGASWTQANMVHAAGASSSPVVAFNSLYPYITSFSGAQTHANALADGTTTVQASITNPIVATADTGTITVTPGLVSMLRVSEPPLVTAGVPFNMTLTAVDVAGNTVLAFTGAKTLQTSATGDVATPENLASVYPAGSTSVTFTNGVATVPVTVFAAGSNGYALNISYVGDALTAGPILNSGPFVPLVVTAGPLDHYATVLTSTFGAPFHKAQAKAVPDNAYANVDTTGSRFDLTIFGRDQWGNNLDFSAAPKTLTLASRLSDGVTPAASPLCSNNGAGCLSGIVLNSASGSVSLTKLASQVGGDFYLYASDGSINTKTASSTLATFVTSHLTVASYSVTPSAPSTLAGNAFGVTVTAHDKAGNVVTGADGDLSSALAFTWSDGVGAAIPGAPTGGATPVLPSALVFSTGSATPLLTFVKAQTLKLQIKDNQTPINTGMSPGNVVVAPSALLAYDIVPTSYPGGVFLPTDSSLTADAAASGRFTLTVTAFDNYGNPKNGESGIVLAAQSVGNALTPANLQNVGSHVPNGLSGIIVNLSGGSDTLANVYYQAAHTVQFVLTGTTATLLHTPRLIFTPTIGTVAGYVLSMSSGTYAAGQNAPATVSAIDFGSNVVAGIDTALNAQTYTFSGPGVSPAPSSLPLTDGVGASPPSLSGAFVGGVAAKTLIFHKAEVINSFSVQDNIGKGSGGAGGVALTITPGLPFKYVLTTATTQPVAGQTFAASLATVDKFSNPENGWTTDNLTWTWTGAYSVTNGNTSTKFSPSLPANGPTAFSGGLVTIPGGTFYLYNSLDSPTLTVTGSRSGAGVTFSGAAMSATANFTPSISPTWSYAYVTNGTACTGDASGADGLGTCGTGSTRMTAASNLSIDSTESLYAHGFDPYGNYKGLAAVNWSAQPALNAAVVPASGSNVTTVQPNQPGSGTVSLDCTGLSPACTSDTTGIISTQLGAETYTVANPVSAAAGTQFTVTVTNKDSHGNVVTSYTGPQSVVISAIGDASTPEGVATLYPSGTQSLTFTAGVASFHATVYSVAAAGIKFQVSQTSPTSILGVGPAVATVTPGPLDHYTTLLGNTYGSPQFNAQAKAAPDNNYASVNGSGSRFDVTIYGRDQWGNNLDFSGSPKTLTLGMRKSDGVTAAPSPVCANNGPACLSGITLNSAGGSVALTMLASQYGGSYYLWATDGTIQTKPAPSNLATFLTSHLTVAAYAVTPSSGNAVAGTAFPVQITALDKGGQPITGADADIGGSLAYTWLDGNGTAIPAAPNASATATLPAALTFSNGVANPTLTFVKIQFLKIQLRDNASPLNAGVSTGFVSVAAAGTLTYTVTPTSYPGNGALPNNSTLPADPSPAGRFNLAVAAFDNFGNARNGESGVYLTAVPVGGALTPGNVQNSGKVPNGLSGGVVLNVSSGTDSVSNVYYPVGQTVQFTIAGTTGTVPAPPQLVFNATSGTVAKYNLSMSPATNIVAGANVATTVTAVDYAGNTVVGVDGSLNTLAYTWAGAGVSPAPSSTPMTAPTPATHFASGVASVTLVFFDAQTIAPLGLTLTDNFTQTYEPVRSGSNGSPVVILPALPYKYVFVPTTLTPQVGVTFGGTLSVVDLYSNPEPTWTSDSLTWTWTNAHTATNSSTTTTNAPLTATNGATTFSGGAVTFPATAFALFNALDTPTLSVAGTNAGGTVTASGSPLTAAAVAIAPSISPVWSYTYITNGTACNGDVAGLAGAGDCGTSGTGGSDRQTAANSFTIDNTETVYAHGFDPFGNYKGLAAGSWSAQAALHATLSQTTGSSTTTINPTSAGSGTLSLTCTSLSAGCTGDTTGLITTGVGNQTYAVTYATTVAAGTPFTVTVTTKDSHGNTVTTYTGSQAVTITAQGDAATPEGVTTLFPSGSQSLSFAAGVATFSATINAVAAAGLKFQVSQTTPTSILGVGPAITAVTPGALDHYTTLLGNTFGGPLFTAQAKATPDNNYASVNGSGSRFDVTIYGRDQWGNNLNFTGSPKTLTLGMRKSDGVTAAYSPVCANNGTACLGGIALNSAGGSVALTMLASQVGGSFYLWATDGTIQTKPAPSNLLSVNTSHLTVASYGVTPSASTATAGVAFPVQVTALDKAGLPVLGADSDITSAMAYTWVDGTGAAIPGAPNSSATPTLPAALAFSNGVASPSVTFVKQQTLRLQVKDNQAPINSGTSPGTVAVSTATSLVYTVTPTTYPGGAAMPNNTALPADPSPAGRFSLAVAAFDNFGNARNGEASVFLTAVPVGSALTQGNVQNSGKVPNGQTGGVVLNLSSGTDSVSNVYYPVGQTVQFTIGGTTGTVPAPPQLVFNPTLGTVQSYALALTPATNIVAGANVAATVTAVDYSGNTVVGIDAGLNGQVYAWAGAGASPAPSNTPMTAPTPATHFASGVAPVTLVFFDAQTIAAQGFTLTDNFNQIYEGSRSGANGAPMTVVPALAFKYVLTPTTTTPGVGATFGATLSVVDVYSNVETGWPSDNLTWTWNNAHTVTNLNTSTLYTATTAPNGATSFTSGVKAVPANFALYNSLDTPTLTVTGTNAGGLTASGSPLTATVAVTPHSSPTYAYAYITNGTACTGDAAGANGSGDCGGGSTRQTAPSTFSIDSQSTIYAQGFDPYGNYKGLAAVNWTVDPALHATLSAATSVNATTIQPIATGVGAVTIDCTPLAAGCVGDTTGAITTTTGNEVFAITHPTAVTAGAPFTVTITLKDSHGNVVTPYSGNQTLAINAANDTASNEGVTALYPSGNQTINFTAGVGTFSATVYSVAAVGLKFQISQSTPTSIFGVGPSLTAVTPGPLEHYTTLLGNTYGAPQFLAQAMSAPDNNYASVNGTGSRFDVTIYGRDQWGNNLDFSSAAKTLTLGMRKSDGVTAAYSPVCSNNGVACLSGITLNSAGGSVVRTMLASQVSGSYYLWASDGTIQTKAAVSNLATFGGSHATVASYTVVPSSSTATAGTSLPVQVTALDKAGYTVIGADADLGTMVFSWRDGAGAAIPGAPNASATATLPSALSFSNGVANTAVTFVQAQTLKLQVKDNQATPNSGISAGTVAVGAANTLVYTITPTTYPGNAAMPNNTSLPADDSPAGRFNIALAALDNFGNPRTGESGVFLKAIPVGNSLHAADLLNTGLTMALNAGGVIVDVSSGTALLSNIYYPVAQTVKFAIAGSSGTVPVQPQLVFTPTLGTVYSYFIGMATTNTIAGATDTATVYAADAAQNIVAGIDAALNGQVFTWSGGGVSPSPSLRAMTAPSPAGTFVNGVGTSALVLYKAAASAFSITLVDDYTPLARGGSVIGGIHVAPALPYAYNLYPGATAPVAGAPFNATLAVVDQYSNPETAWTTDSLTWTWSGTHTVTNASTSTVFSAQTDPGGATTFTNGTVVLPATFALYNRADTPTLTVTGTNSGALTASGSALTASVLFAPVVSPVWAYSLITDGTACTGDAAGSAGSGDCGAGSTRQTAASALSVDLTKTYYAHAFDPYGNDKGLAAVNWSATAPLNATMSSPTGSNSSTMTPTAPGVGTVSIVCTALTAGCTGDTTGTITTSPGSETFAITHAAAVTAGTAFPVTITVKDSHGNTVTSYSGSQSLNISANINPATDEGTTGTTFPSGTQSLTFTAGVATFNATMFTKYAVGLVFTVTQNTITGQGPAIASVALGALHHYADTIGHLHNGTTAQAKATLDSTYSDQTVSAGVYGTRFRADIAGRDQWGNNLDMSASPTTLTVSLMKSDGVTASDLPLKCSDNQQTCLNGVVFNAASGSMSIDNLAYDVGGTYYVWVTDGGGIHTKITGGASALITEATSRYTVNHYNFTTVPTNATAGNSFVATVAAIDNAGHTILGGDTDISALTFAWADSADGALGTTHQSPSGTSPIVNATAPSATTLAFASGTSAVTLTLYKAESLVLKVTDSLTKVGTAGSAVVVNYSPALQYKITSSAANGTYAADQSAVQTLTVSPFDAYGNSRPGDSSATLMVVRSTGATNVWNLEGTSNSVGSGGLTFTALGGPASIANAYYRVAQAVTYSVANTAGSTVLTPSHTFTSTQHSVASYGVSHAATTTINANPLINDNNLTVTVTALDPAGNTVSAADAVTNLSSLVFGWSPSHASPAARSLAPVLPTHLTFANGVATPVLSLYRAEAGLSLTATDNHSFTANSVTTGARSGASAASVTVLPAAVSAYFLSSAAAPAAQAGVPFDVTVSAHDQYDNLATGVANDTLTFAWSAGGSSSVVNPKTGSALPAAYLGSAARSFSGGSFSSSGTPFSLYRAGEAATLTVTGSSLSTTLAFNAVANPTTGYVLITDSSTCTGGLGLSCSGNVLNGAAFAMTTDIPKILYAYGFDAFGNYKAPSSVNWSGTNLLAGKLSPASGAANTTLAATQTTTGTVTADCATGTAGCVNATTGSISVTVGNITKLVYTSSTINGTTDGCYAVTVQAQDNNSNPVNVTSNNYNISFSNVNSTPAVNDGAFYSNAICTTALSGGATTIPNGQSSQTVYFAKPTVATATQIQVGDGSHSATQNDVIGVGVLTKIAYSNSALSQAATTGCGTLTFVVTDAHNNTGPLPGAPTTFTFQTSSTSAQTAFFYTGSDCATGALGTGASETKAYASVTGGTVYYIDQHAGTPTITLSATLAGGAALRTQIETMSPGAFDFSSPAAASSVKDTVTVTWGASAGANNYSITYGSGSCSSGATVQAGTSFALPSGQNSSNFRVCVTAQGYDASLPTIAATTNATYALLIDNVVPTQAITVPGAGVAMIGPVTAATGASGGTTTFTGTAADDRSGVNKVQLQLQDTFNSQYWTGTAWQVGAASFNASGTTSWTYGMANANFTNGHGYTLLAVATDNSLNVQGTASSRTFTWNSTPPTATLSGQPGTYTNGSAFAVTVAGTSVVNYQYALVAGATCGTPTYGGVTAVGTQITSSLGTDGQKTLCVVGIDQAGNVQVTPTPAVFTRDTVAPSVGVGTPNPVAVNAAYAIPGATSSDNATGVSTVWSVNSTVTGTGKDCAAGNLTFSNTAILAPTVTVATCTYGIFTLTLTATDGAGNTAAANLTFTYDSRAPTVSTVAAAATGVYDKVGASVTVNVTFSKPVNVNIGGGAPTLALSTSRNATCGAVSNNATMACTYTVQAGDNSATNPQLAATNPNVALNIASSAALTLNGATIADTVGSGNAASLSGMPTSGASALTNSNVVIDTYAPTSATDGFVTISLPATQSNVTNPQIKVSSLDVKTYQWAVVAGSTAGACPAVIGGYSAAVTYSAGTAIPGINISNINTYPDGSYVICVVGTDNAGNVQALADPTFATWIKDTTAPMWGASNANIATAITGPGAVAYTNAPAITWVAPTDTNGISSYTLLIAKANDATCATPIAGQTYAGISGGALSKTVTTALIDGGYNACLTATDPAGNVSVAATSIFQVETDTVHIVYTTQSGATYGVNYSNWPNGNGTWATPVAIKTVNGGATLGRSSLALSSTNVPYVAFEYNDGAGNAYLLANNKTSSWASQTTLNSSAVRVVGLYPSLGLDSGDTAAVLAQDNNAGTTDDLGVYYGSPWAEIDTSLGGQPRVNDSSIAVGTNDALYYVYSISNGTNWQLRFRTNSAPSATRYETVPVDASCTDAMKATIFIKPGTSDAVAVAYACVTGGGACSAFYVERGNNSTIGLNGAASGTWGNARALGTMKASCSVAAMTGAGGRVYRPSVAIDRQNAGKSTHIAWYDADNTRIVSSSNENGGTWANEFPYGSLSGTAGEPSIGLDQWGHSYILYVNNGSLYMVTNNGRAAGAVSGSWTTPTLIDTNILSVGTLGITGMMGRSNNSNK